MNHIKLIITTFLLSVSSSSFGAGSYCDTWGCIGTITTLYTTTGGKTYVGMDADEKLANCAPESNVYFTLKNDADDRVYSSLLSSYVSGKKIQLRVSEGSVGCIISYVRLDASY